MIFILYSIYTNIILKKKSYKKDRIDLSSSSGLKIVFILLTKIVVVYIYLTIIYIKDFGFENFSHNLVEIVTIYFSALFIII